MAIVKMKKLRLAALGSQQTDLMYELQRLGCVELRPCEAPEGYLTPDTGGDRDQRIEALQEQAFDLSLTGFDPDELAGYFSDDTEDDTQDDDFDLTAALEKASFVERGDVWTVCSAPGIACPRRPPRGRPAPAGCKARQR